MKNLSRCVWIVLLLVGIIQVQSVWGSPQEPTPDPTFRALRSDYVKNWYIYNDSNVDGILDPGDTFVRTFKNWWTPASSHSQYNYSRDGGTGLIYGADSDINASPINYASHKNSGKEDFWLGLNPTADNEHTIQFYMSYSQFDNNDWKGGYTYSSDPTIQAIVSQRHEYRNGWTLGWNIHSERADNSNPQTLAGKVDMDIFIHNGRGVVTNPDGSIDVPGFGKSYSNPQVSVSNDISSKARDASVYVPGCTPAEGGERYHPPVFDDATGTYSWAANATRMTYNGLDASDLNDIVNSMELREYDPYGLGPGQVIWPSRMPSEILANLTDHNGNPYTYQDAFLERAFYHDGASDGGVIAGLAGQSLYDPQINNWGDQQVIRIDISEETLMSGDPNTDGNIDKIIFWDFGDPGTGDQVNPTPIIFYVDLTQTVAHGQIYWQDPVTGNKIWFPENRIYIAQVTLVPEPTSLFLILAGAATILPLWKKRK